jgi:hypothetical protein
MTSDSALHMPNGQFRGELINSMETSYLLWWLSQAAFCRAFPMALRTVVPVLALRLRNVGSVCPELTPTNLQSDADGDDYCDLV